MAATAGGATHQPIALVAGDARLDSVAKALEAAGRRVRRLGDVAFDFKLAALNDGETAATQVAFGIFSAIDFESDENVAAATGRALRLRALNRVAVALVAVDGVDTNRLCAFQERLHDAALDEELGDAPSTAAASDLRALGKQFAVIPTGPSVDDVLAATTALLRGIDPVRRGRVEAHIATTAETAHASAGALFSLLAACPGVGSSGSGDGPTPQQLEMLVDRVSSLAGLALDVQTSAGIDAVAACLPPHAATALCMSMGCLPDGVVAHE